MADTEKPAHDEEFYYLLTEGSELLQAGRVDEARRQFERALEMNPAHEQALNLLGLALFRLNHLDRARQIFADLVHNSPVEPSLRLNLAMVHLKTGKLDDAAAELEHVLELNPDHPRATSYMGLVLERKGDLDRAAAFYERAGNKKRADEIRAYRPTATGTFPLPNLAALVAKAAEPSAAGAGAASPPAQPAPPSPPSTPPRTAASTPPPPAAAPSAPPQPASTPPRPAVMPSAQALAASSDSVELTGMNIAPRLPSLAPKPITGVVSIEAVHQGDPRGSAANGARASQPIEAAALTAAATAALRKPAEPPPPGGATRDNPLGYTIDVDDRAAAPAVPEKAAEATAPEKPPERQAPPPPEERPADAPARLPEERLRALAAAAVATEEPTLRGDGMLAFPIPDVGYVRTDLLVALTGQFEIEPVNRRYRGKRTDSLFGGVDGAIAALLGRGLALLHPDKLVPRLLALKNEELYLVESALLAFTQGLVWENGRLPSEADRDLDIVHLRGSGRLVVGSKTPLVTFAVRPDMPCVVHASRLVGWSGQLVPYRAPLPGLPENAKRVPVVRFEGTGTVLVV